MFKVTPHELKVHDRIMVFGTFDYLHPGHIALFAQAKRLAKKLIVIVARDVTTTKMKKRKPDHTERSRLAVVSRQELVDRARLGNIGDVYRVIETEKPDAIGLGYDQWASIPSLRHELSKRGLRPKIYRLKPYRPDIHKSSRIRQNLAK